MFIVDHRQNVIQQDHSGAGSHEHMGYGLWHILCNNSFSSVAEELQLECCLVWDLALQGRGRLLERVQITEVLGWPNLEQKKRWTGLYSNI